MTSAVIDIGTNSARLYIEENGKKIIKKLNTTRLGEGIGSSSVLLFTAMERTANAVKEFVDYAKKYTDRIFIYATNAVRSAENKNEFSQMLFEKTGIMLDIISGEQEALIAYVGAVGSKEGCAVIDIGGGSTEVICMHNEKLTSLSLNMGAVRLKEKFGQDHDIAQVNEYIDTQLSQYAPLYPRNASTLIGVSGTPTTILSLSLNLKQYVPEKIQDVALSLATLDETVEMLFKLPLDERRKFCGDFADRADIIVFGGRVLARFMKMYGFNEITVSDRDSLEGYLLLKNK